MSIVDDAIASVLRGPQWGERRFACECGEHFKDPYLVVMHTFSGHEAVAERYEGGVWHFDPTPISDVIVEKLRLRGESIADFTRRLQARADELEREAKLLTEAERARGMID